MSRNRGAKRAGECRVKVAAGGGLVDVLTIWVALAITGRVSSRLGKSRRLKVLTNLAPSCELTAADIGGEAVIVWHKKITLL